jgi:hypothetical protein
MKKVLSILFFSLAAYATNAQVKPETMAELMKHRMYPCHEVEYNAILLAQNMYRHGNYDSLDALCAFWSSHCEPNERIFSLTILNSIRANRFREFVNSNQYLISRNTSSISVSDQYSTSILNMLVAYRSAAAGGFDDEAYRNWQEYNHPLPKDVTDYYNHYEQYYAFLKEMARSLMGKRTYAPIEDYLLRFYAAPDSVRYAELDSAIYNRTVLQERYAAYTRYRNSITGVGVGLRGGVWLPQSKLALLGNHPYLGYQIGGKTNKFAWDIAMDIRFGKSPNQYEVMKNDTIRYTNHFSGINVGIEFSHQLARFGRQQIDFQWAVGYEGFQTLPTGSNTSTGQQALVKYIGSAYFSPGFVWRVYTGQRFRADLQRYTYLAIAARYHIVDFNNTGGTDLHGNFSTVGIIWGSYRNNNKKFPVLE